MADEQAAAADGTAVQPGYLPEPIAFLRILSVSDHQHPCGEHKPPT
jgi:hypothetical protein